MKKSNTFLTIALILLIVIAIICTLVFNKPNKPLEPNITKPYEEANNKIKYVAPEVKEEKICLASFTTNITYPDDARTHNIKTVCNYLNKTIIKSGEVFSFNNTLGPFNEEQGYTQSTGFDANGKIIKIIGGGICQVSSTLYNVALMSDFEIIERNEHSAPVDYVEQGKDATVCFPSVDLKFKNTTKYDLEILSSCDGNKVTVEAWKK